MMLPREEPKLPNKCTCYSSWTSITNMLYRVSWQLIQPPYLVHSLDKIDGKKAHAVLTLFTFHSQTSIEEYPETGGVDAKNCHINIKRLIQSWIWDWNAHICYWHCQRSTCKFSASWEAVLSKVGISEREVGQILDRISRATFSAATELVSMVLAAFSNAFM